MHIHTPHHQQKQQQQGKNPFAEPCTPEEVGSYEVYVTLHGDKVRRQKIDTKQKKEGGKGRDGVARAPACTSTHQRKTHKHKPQTTITNTTISNQGYPNEIRLLKNASDAAARSYLTPVIMRFYGMDPTMDRHDFEARVWGGVRPPKVEYLEGDGRWVEVRRTGGVAVVVPCGVVGRKRGGEGMRGVYMCVWSLC